MLVGPLSRSHLPGTASTSVKHEKVLKSETPILENSWTFHQCFRSWPTFCFTSNYSCHITAVSLSLSTVWLHPACASKGFSHQPIPLILERDG